MDINALPKYVLEKLNATQAILFCSEETEGKVLVTTSLKPEDMHVFEEAQSLDAKRKKEGFYSITLVVSRLSNDMIRKSTYGLPQRFQVISELDALLEYKQEVYVAYAVMHFNSKPLGEFTVFIGGDCFRADQPNIEAILERTQDLAKAMLRKAVMIFPEIYALHGGKKGEWIIVDASGEKIAGLSEEAIVALGTFIIPMGIIFLNTYKKLKWDPGKTSGGVFVNPDTGSPDVLSGQHWAQMCNAWSARGIDLLNFTCLPGSLGGPSSPSSKPTGYGIAVTAIELAKRRFGEGKINELRILCEALGGVGTSFIDAMINRFGIKAENIIAFDPNPETCQKVLDKYHIGEAFALSHSEFYSKKLDEYTFDIWVNNGLGDNTDPAIIERLLDRGVKVFCGAANNVLKVDTRSESLELILNSDAWIWPDEAASGGGWTLAAVDLYKRSQGIDANDRATEDHILDTIVARNEGLIDSVFAALKGTPPTGREIWEQINAVIDERVERSLSATYTSNEIIEKANVKTWEI